MANYTDEVVVRYRSEVESGLRRELALYRETAQAQLAASQAIQASSAAAAQGVSALVGRFSELDRRVEETARRAAGMRLGQQFANVAGQLDPAIRATTQYAQRQDVLARALAAGLIPQREHARLLALARAEYQNAAAGADRYGISLGGIKGAMAGLGLALGIREIKEFGEAAFQSFATMDRAGRVLTVVTGSAGGASREIAFLRAETDRLGVSFEGSVSGYGKFVAASNLAGIAMSDIRDIYTGVATAASALGLSQQNVELTFLGLQQMASKGTVQMQELKQQVGDHIPGALSIMARALGKSEAELFKMVEAGDVLAKDALPKFARELKKTYEEMAKLGAASPLAQVQRLKNEFFDLTVVAGKEMAPAIGDLADLLSKIGSSDDAISFFRDAGQAMGDTAKMTGLIVSGLQEVTGAIDGIGGSWAEFRAQTQREAAQIVDTLGGVVADIYEMAAGLQRALASAAEFGEPWARMTGAGEAFKEVAAGARENAEMFDQLAIDARRAGGEIADGLYEAAGASQELADGAGKAAKSIKDMNDAAGKPPPKPPAPPDEKVVAKYESVTAAIIREIDALVDRTAVLGDTVEAQRAVDRAIAVGTAVSKLHEDSTEDMVEDTIRLAGQLFDLGVAFDNSSDAMDRQRDVAEAVSDSIAELARAQDLLAAQMLGGDDAAEELAAIYDDYATAIERGMFVTMEGIPILTAEGQALLLNGAAAREAERARAALSDTQADGKEHTEALAVAEYDLAVATERHRILTEEGAAALARYDLELRALAETASVFGREAAGLGTGPMTDEARAYRDKVFAKLTTEGKTEIVQASNEASEESAAFYVATFSEAMASLAREGWDNWEEVALETIVKVIEFWEQQQAQMRLQQATYGSTSGGGGTDAASSAGQAGAMSGSGWGAMIAAAVAFYQMMEARSAQNRAERFGTQFSVGGRSFSTGYRGVAYGVAGQESPFEGYEARAMAREVEETVLAIISSMGGFVETLSHMNVKIRNDGKEFVVTVGDYVRTFDSLDEAIRHGIVEMLSTSTINGLSENMQKVIEAARRLGDDLPLEEMEAMVEHARRLDALGLPAVVADMREAFERFQAAIRADSRVGFGLDALRDELAAALQEIGDSLRDELRSFIPGSDALEQVERLHELGDAVRAHNEELARQAAAVAELTRQEEILRYNRENPPAPPPGGWPDPGSPRGGGGLDPNSQGWGGHRGGFLDPSGNLSGILGEWFDTFDEGVVRALTSTGDAAEDLGDTMFDMIGPIREWNEGLPDPIEFEELARAMEALTATQEQQLASLLLDHVRDGDVRARLQRAEHTLLMLELEARYAALVALGTLSDEVLDTYRDAIDDVAAGGRRGRRGGGSGAGEARREAAEEFRREAAAVAASLAGATDAQLGYAEAVRQLRERATEARIPTEELAAAISDLAELHLREVAAAYRETAAAAGEADIETAMRLARERMTAALADALAAAADDPAAYADAVAAIQAGFAAEVATLLDDALVGLGDSARALRIETAETAVTIRYLLDHLAELGLTAEEVADAVAGAQVPRLLDLIEAQAERVGDEETLARIREQRAELELAFARIQFEAAVSLLAVAGAIDPAMQSLIDRARELFELPTAVDGEDPADTATRDLLTQLAREGLSPAQRGLLDFLDATAALREELENALAVEKEYADATGDRAVYERALYRAQLAAAQSLVQEIETFLGVPLPVEMTQQLGEAMFEVARAELLVALASEEMVAALTAAGVDIARLVDMVSGADYRPGVPAGGGVGSGVIPGMRGGTGGTSAGGGRTQTDLEDAREALADWVEGLRRQGLHPLEQALLDLGDRFGELRDNLLAAGGSIGELAAAEAAYAAERARLIEELDSELRDVIADLRGSGDPSLSPAARFAAAQAEFDALVAAAMSGDLEAREQLAGALAELVESGTTHYGTATEEFQQFMAQALAAAEAVLNARLDLPGLPPPGAAPSPVVGGTGVVLGQTPIGSGQAYYGEGPWYPPYTPPGMQPVTKPGEQPVTLSLPVGGLEVKNMELSLMLTEVRLQTGTLASIDARLRSIDARLAQN